MNGSWVTAKIAGIESTANSRSVVATTTKTATQRRRDAPAGVAHGEPLAVVARGHRDAAAQQPQRRVVLRVDLGVLVAGELVGRVEQQRAEEVEGRVEGVEQRRAGEDEDQPQHQREPDAPGRAPSAGPRAAPRSSRGSRRTRRCCRATASARAGSRRGTASRPRRPATPRGAAEAEREQRASRPTSERRAHPGSPPPRRTGAGRRPAGPPRGRRAAAQAAAEMSSAGPLPGSAVERWAIGRGRSDPAAYSRAGAAV